MSNVIPRYSEGQKVEFHDKVSIWLNRAAGFFSKDARPVTPADFSVTAKEHGLLLSWTPDARADFYNVYVSSTNDVNARELLARLYGNTSSYTHYLAAVETRHYWLEAATNTGRVGELVQTRGTSTGAGGGGDSTTTAAYASRPAAGNAGDLFLPSDGFYLERDTGSAWEPWGPIFPFTAPANGDFSWVNQGSATVTTTNGGIHIASPSNGSAQNLRLRVKTLPSAPYTITVGFIPLLHYADFSQIVVGLRNSTNDDAVLVKFANNGQALQFSWEQWNSNSSGGVGSYIGAQGSQMLRGPIVWLRFRDDNTNRILSWSSDGQNFIQLHSIGRTNFVTPDQFCIGVNPFSQETGVTLLSFKQTA